MWNYRTWTIKENCIFIRTCQTSARLHKCLISEPHYFPFNYRHPVRIISFCVSHSFSVFCMYLVLLFIIKKVMSLDDFTQIAFMFRMENYFLHFTHSRTWNSFVPFFFEVYSFVIEKFFSGIMQKWKSERERVRNSHRERMCVYLVCGLFVCQMEYELEWNFQVGEWSWII